MVDDLLQLNALQIHEDGEYAYVKETQEIYCWHDGWQKVDIQNQGIEVNLYELSKNIMSQMDPMTEEELAELPHKILSWYAEDTKTNKYYMLLCRDINYYTLFAQEEVGKDAVSFSEAVIDIVAPLGPVYGFEKTDAGALEFWIKPNESETPLAFYLFPYDAGVVHYV